MRVVIGWEGRPPRRPPGVRRERRRLRPPDLRHALRAQPRHLPEPAPLPGRRPRQGRRRGQGLRREGSRGTAARSAARARRCRPDRGALRRRRRRAVGARTAGRSLRRTSRRAAGAATCASPGSVDVLVGEARPEPPVTAALDERVAALDALSPAERSNSGGGVVALHALLRLPPGLPAVLLRALHRREDRAPVDRDLAAPARQPRLEPDARRAPRRPLRRLRRVRARLPGRHSPGTHQPQAAAGGLRALRLHRLRDPTVPAPIGAYATDDTQDFIR